MNRLFAALIGLFVATSCAQGGAVENGPDSSTGDATASDGSSKDSGAADAPHTPKLESTWPPYGLTWTTAGDLGRPGGLTWTYTGIQRGSLLHIYWIVCDDPTMPCGVSLDGPITTSSQWQFSATDSNLSSGKLVFTNSTAIVTDDAGTVPLSGRLTVTIVDSSNAPIAFATVASLGVTARDGKYGAEIKGTGFKVTALIEVQDTTAAWTAYLDYYDNAHTVPPDAGNAYVSFGGSFYDD